MVKAERDTASKVRVKPPTFESKKPWPNYFKQFDTAPKVNGWSKEEKATSFTFALREDAADNSRL